MPAKVSQKIKSNQQIFCSDKSVILGILNVTPDSFSDGGQFAEIDAAVEHALLMHEQGAQIIDIGGESTRPGAGSVSVQEEIDRVVPVIEKISELSDVLISIDTSKPDVMSAAIIAGASMVNDVNALRAEDAVLVCTKYGVHVCLMHMQGEPRTMQDHPAYEDIVSDVRGFLLKRAEVCVSAGMKKEHIIIDCGFGFGKTIEHNLQLLKHYDDFCNLGFPVMMGISRKSMLGAITGCGIDERLIPSVAAIVVGYQKGGRLFRVHDVEESKNALLLCEALDNVN